MSSFPYASTRQQQITYISNQADNQEKLTMNKGQVLQLLSQSKAELQARFGVTSLSLFGSTARDTATVSSDVDILVAFDGPATSKRYFGVQFYLEDLLGCAVDLVTEKALRKELRPFIDQEKIHV
jgi:predicted nucleotidyltransferase